MKPEKQVWGGGQGQRQDRKRSVSVCGRRRLREPSSVSGQSREVRLHNGFSTGDLGSRLLLDNKIEVTPGVLPTKLVCAIFWWETLRLFCREYAGSC